MGARDEREDLRLAQEAGTRALRLGFTRVSASCVSERCSLALTRKSRRHLCLSYASKSVAAPSELLP